VTDPMSDHRTSCITDSGGRDPRAMRQTLRVASVEGAFVRLEANRMSGCAHCAARSGCGTKALADLVESRPIEISVPRKGAVSPGDEVVVSMSAGAFLGAAGLAYLLPPASLVLAAPVFSALGLSDLLVALLCLPVLALSLLPAWLADRRGRLAATLSIDEVIPARGRPAP